MQIQTSIRQNGKMEKGYKNLQCSLCICTYLNMNMFSSHMMRSRRGHTSVFWKNLKILDYYGLSHPYYIILSIPYFCITRPAYPGVIPNWDIVLSKGSFANYVSLLGGRGVV